MEKSVKKRGKKVALIILVSILALLLLAVSLFFGIASCSKQGTIIEPPKEGKTLRYPVPTDGSLPTDHSALENIGYLASVLDSQPFYHAYANNSSKASGYEQITQTWKDYKSADASGMGYSVMVCSDLSYSMFVQASTQSCFIGSDDAYMRGGKKPKSKNTVPTEIEWSTEQPEYYSNETYLTKYGDFSTELSVYLINESTLESADSVVVNSDGTYSLKLTLKPEAACWYQYGMKTRGSLKGYPEFKKIEITFTFDGNWTVLSSYCEETASISPSAMGGLPVTSNAKTTTVYDYSESGFDSVHYAYFEDFFKQYVGTKPVNTPSGEEEPDALTVLGSAFGKVMSEEGQQFSLDLTIGGTNYTGKVYAQLSDLSDIMGSLNVRFALEKKDSGKQDLYAEFKDGEANVYFGNDFAVRADINKVSESVSALTGLINTFATGLQQAAVAAMSDEDTDDGFNIEDLLCLEYTDTSACVFIDTDDLLGFGIGVDVKINCTRTIDEDGSTYNLIGVNLNSIQYGGETINFTANILPDENSSIIYRQTDSTPADLADYIDSVYGLLSSTSLKVELGLDETLFEGLSVDAVAYVNFVNQLTALVEANVEYNGITAGISAYYVYDGGYGTVYLTLTEFNGNAYNAKIYCQVDELLATINRLLEFVNANPAAAVEDTQSVDTLAQTINNVLALDFGKVISNLSANENAISFSVNPDLILEAFGVSLGIDLGEINLTLSPNDGKATLSGEMQEIGLTLNVSGSDTRITKPAGNYVDILTYVDSVYGMLASETLKAELELNGLIDGLEVKVEAYVKVGTETAAQAEITVKYNKITATLSAYYEIDTTAKDYGTVYITLTELNGKQYNAKIYCDVKSAAESIEKLIALYSEEQTSEAQETADILGVLLNLNYNEIISADNSSLKVTLDVDKLLTELEVELEEIQLGTLNLTLSPNDGKATLSGEMQEIGLTLNVSGSDTQITKPAGNFVDILTYVDSVYGMLASETLKAELELNGLIDGLEVKVEAYVKAGTETAAQANITIAYDKITATLSAYYEIDTTAKDYGTVYITLTELNGKQYNAKIYCDVKSAAESIEKLIALYSEEQTSEAQETADILGILLNLNYNEIISADNSSLKVTLDVDKLLTELEVELEEMQLGTLNLTLSPNDGKATLRGEMQEIGLTLNVSGSDTQITKPAGNFVDIVTYIELVTEFLDTNTYLVEIIYNGTEIEVFDSESGEVEVIDLSGLSIIAPLQVAFGDNYKTITVFAPITVSYNGIQAVINAYYSIDTDNKDYGTVYLTLTEFNGQQFNAKLFCSIKDTAEAVKQLLTVIEIEGSDEASEEKDIISLVTGVLLGLDYNKVISADNKSINITLDVNELLEAFEINLGVNFGTLALEFTAQDGKAVFSGSLQELGLTLKINAEPLPDIIAPDSSEYLDITELVELITAAAEQAEKIIKAQDILFYIDDATLTADGVAMSVTADGEVSWADGKIRVALDAVLTIFEDGRCDRVDVKVIYDETADDGEPLVTFTINKLGMKIYRSDIDNLTDNFNELITAINALIDSASGKSDDSGTENFEDIIEQYSEIQDNETQDNEEPISTKQLIDEILASTNLQKVLKVVLGFVSDLTVTLDKTVLEDGDTKITALVINSLNNGKLTLSADGSLSLKLENNNIFNLDVTVVAGDADNRGAKINALKAEFAKTEIIGEDEDAKEVNVYTFIETSEGSSLVKAIYEYLFNLVESELTIKEILGHDSFTVKLKLDGNLSAIDALKGITAEAELYYTEGLNGTQIGTKLIEGDVTLVIDQTVVVLKARYFGQTVFIDLVRVANTTFTDVKICADVHDLYSAGEAIVKILKSENLAEIVGKIIIPEEVTETESQESDVESVEIQGEKSSAVAKLIGALLSLDTNGMFEYDNSKDGTEENIIKFSPDILFEAFGIDVKVGTVTLRVNPETHEVTAEAIIENADSENAPWLIFNAYASDREEVALPDTQDYIDICFVSTLIDDICKTLALTGRDENGDIKVLYSFTGELVAKVQIVGLNISDVKFSSVTLTVGLDKDGDFYFSFLSELQDASAIGITAATKSWISVTYSDGLITFGRDVKSATPKFKVMTTDYLVDNLMDCIYWLLDTGSFAKGVINTGLGSTLDELKSGLDSTEDYYLYNELSSDGEIIGDSEFSLSQFITGMNIAIGDNSSTFGDYENVKSQIASLLGLSDNYYGFGLDISSLLGSNTIKNIYAAIVRDDEVGIKGLDAYCTIGSDSTDYLFVTAKFDNGPTYEHAENYYKTATKAYGIDTNYFKNYDDRTFGCYDTENKEYIASAINKPCTLTVYVIDENKEYTVNERGDKYILSTTVKSGSTVYLLESETYLNDGTLKYIYVDENGNDLGLSFVITQDTVIYAMVVDGKEVTFHSHDGQTYTGTLFVGTTLPEYSAQAVENKTFAGWYLEESLETYVTALGANHYDYYAKFVDSTVTVNGVIYTFVRDVATGGYYIASGYNSSQIAPYTYSGSTLVLESEINGYQVTGIGSGAFKGAMLKNVIVPESVKTVGTQAFMNNYGMESAVFLAQIVHFSGTAFEGKDTTVFYNCSDTNGGKTSSLKLYYNEFTADDTTYWNCFRVESSGLINKKYTYYSLTEDNANLFGSGKWAYIVYEADGENAGYTLEELGLKNFVITSTEYDRTAIENAVNEVLNAITVQYGYINAYNVTIFGDYYLDSNVHTITVTVTLKPESEWEYDTNVTVNLVSSVEFTLDGISLQPVDRVYVLTTESYTEISNAVPADSTYVFLGWAKLNGDGYTLTFTQAVAENNLTLYAIWAVNNENVTDFMFNTQGTLPRTPAVKDNYNFVGWQANGSDISSLNTDTTILSANVEEEDDGSCVAEGTLITLADGTQKAVEELTGDEMLLVWNLFTGTFDAAPIVFIDSDPAKEYEVINLFFSDDTQVKIISEHAFWDCDLNEYVYLDKYAAEYIGHSFNKQVTGEFGELGWVTVELVDVVITVEYTTAWSPVTYGHLCYYVNGMLSIPGGINGLFNIFETDGNMRYDSEAMQRDIETYGLFTYEEFAEILPIPETAFEAFGGAYLKVAVGKGMIDFETLTALVMRYQEFF